MVWPTGICSNFDYDDSIFISFPPIYNSNHLSSTLNNPQLKNSALKRDLSPEKVLPNKSAKISKVIQNIIIKNNHPVFEIGVGEPCPRCNIKIKNKSFPDKTQTNQSKRICQLCYNHLRWSKRVDKLISAGKKCPKCNDPKIVKVWLNIFDPITNTKQKVCEPCYRKTKRSNKTNKTDMLAKTNKIFNNQNSPNFKEYDQALNEEYAVLSNFLTSLTNIDEQII